MGFTGKQEAEILIKDPWELSLLSSLDVDVVLLMLFNARIKRSYLFFFGGGGCGEKQIGVKGWLV